MWPLVPFNFCQSCFANSAAIHPGHNFLSTDDILAAVENEVGSTAERAGSADSVEGDADEVEDLKDSEGEAEEAEEAKDDDDWCILCYKCGQCCTRRLSHEPRLPRTCSSHPTVLRAPPCDC